VAGLVLALVTTSPALAQPANDDFDTARVVTGLPFIDSISTVDATTAGDDPFCNGFEHTVWYSFTPAQDVTIRADTSGSDYATSLSAYTGSRGALSQVACASFPAQITFNARANTTYFFMVASVCCGNPGGNLVFRLNPPPTNDDIDNAAMIGGLPFTDSITTADATSAADDPSCNGNGHSVWYSFTPTRDLPVKSDTSGSDYATSLSVYTGSRGALSQVACASAPAQVSFNASANTTYFFMVASAAGGPGGNLVFNVTEGPPANDEIGGAIPLTLNTTVTEDTTLATTAPTDPTQCEFEQSSTVWFSFTATQSQPINVDRSGSSYSGATYVLTDLGSGPVVIACSFRFENGVRFDASAGKTYYFMIAGGFSGGGQLQLSLRPGIVLTVVINPNGNVDRQGIAVVGGTLVCSQGIGPPFDESPTLAVDLRQRVSKTLVIEGTKDLRIPCPTTPTGWSATIIGSNGPFRKGQAEVLVTGSACDAIGCDTPEVRQIVTLQRK
jgi:hypothetical protein